MAAAGHVHGGVPVQRRVPRGRAGAARRAGPIPGAHRLQGRAEDSLHRRHTGRALLARGLTAAGRLRGGAQRQIRLCQTRYVTNLVMDVMYLPSFTKKTKFNYKNI